MEWVVTFSTVRTSWIHLPLREGVPQSRQRHLALHRLHDLKESLRHSQTEHEEHREEIPLRLPPNMNLTWHILEPCASSK